MNITLIYFIYGLSFFTMGLALVFETRRSPLLAESRVLKPLAIFGLIHGGHEWFEMFLDKSDWLLMDHSLIIHWLRILILTISFIPLCIFAWRSINPQKTYEKHELPWWGFGFSIYLLGVIVFGYFSGRSHPDELSHIDAFLRLLLAVPGAVMAGVALNRQAEQTKEEGRIDLSKTFKWSAAGFIFYGFTQIFVPALDVFPASLINSSNFMDWTGVPIQFIRAILAMILMVSLINAIQLVERERQVNFLSAQHAKIAAVEQLKLELLKREKLRQELMRHIVLAQEDERTRIARELHDETSQILTGFSLHLAALNEIVGNNPQANKQIGYLQSLSKQMSQGLYRLIRDLRPAQLDDLGLIAALNYLVGEIRKSLNLKVHLQINGNHQRMDSLVETVFFRVAQEALTNVARHAYTQEAQVLMVFNEELIELQISDQGMGFNPDLLTTFPNRLGLTGMKERVESVGGKLEIWSMPQRGTIVKMSISTQIALNKNNVTSP